MCLTFISIQNYSCTNICKRLSDSSAAFLIFHLWFLMTTMGILITLCADFFIPPQQNMMLPSFSRSLNHYKPSFSSLIILLNEGLHIFIVSITYSMRSVLSGIWTSASAWTEVEIWTSLSWHLGTFHTFKPCRYYILVSFFPTEFYHTNIHTEHIILLKVFRDQDLNTGLVLPTSGIKEGQALSWPAEVESSNPVFTIELARIWKSGCRVLGNNTAASKGKI